LATFAISPALLCSGDLRGQLAFALHHPEARVVERVLQQVRHHDEAREDRVIVRDVGAAGAAVLELDLKRVLELPQVPERRLPFETWRATWGESH
jgi:hypothetical protein